jgi:hypothetical protein
MNENPQTKEVTTLTRSLTDEAQGMMVRDQDTYRRAGELLLAVKELRKKIAATFKPIKQRIDEAKREVLAQERAADAPLLEAEYILSPQIIAYEKSRERLRQAEQLRLQVEAHRHDEERRLREAVLAEESGEQALAMSILEETCVAPVAVPRTLPRRPGLSLRKTWGFRITNPGLIPREYLTPDLVKIGGVVRALKNQCHIPGIEVYEEETLQGRQSGPTVSPKHHFPDPGGPPAGNRSLTGEQHTGGLFPPEMD